MSKAVIEIRRMMAITRLAPLLVMLALCPSTYAGNINWQGDESALWSVGGNWEGGNAPGSSDVAVFDGAASVSNCTIDVNTNVAGVLITNNYSGTINQGATFTVGSSGWSQSCGAFMGNGNTITLNGNFSLSGGTFTAGAQTITTYWNWTCSGGTLDLTTSDSTVVFGGVPGWPNALSGYFTQTITGSQTFKNLTFNGNNRVYIVADGATLTVMGTLALTEGYLNQNTVPSSGTIDAQNGVTAGTFRGGTGRIHITGANSRTVTFPTNTVLPAMTVNAPSVTLNTSNASGNPGIVAWDGTLTLTATSGPFIQGGNTTFIIPSLVLNNAGLVMGTNGVLRLTGSGTPLSGSGTLNVTANTPNTVEYTGTTTSDVIAAAPAAAYHNLALAPAAVRRVAACSVSGLAGLQWGNSLSSAAIDTANGYAYFGADTRPGFITKIRLSDFTCVGVLTLNTDEDKLYGAAVLDSSEGYLYFGTRTSPGCTAKSSPGYIVKVRLSDFTRVASFSHTNVAWYLCAAIDANSTPHYAYFGGQYLTTGTNAGASTVLKMNLATFTNACEPQILNTTPPAANEYQMSNPCYGFESAIIDPASGYGWFGSRDANSQIVKINLSDTSLVSMSPAGTSGCNFFASACADFAAGYGYFGTRNSPAKVAKVRLSDLAFETILTLGAGLNSAMAAVIDPANDAAYFSSNTDPAYVFKIRPSNMTFAGKVQMNVGDRKLCYGVHDPANGYAYYCAESDYSRIVKVSLGTGHAMTLGTGGGQTLAVNGNLTFGRGSNEDCVVADGAANNPTVAVGSNLGINGGSSFTAPSIVNVAGNWTNGGTFTAGSGTVTLNGTNQTVSGTTTFCNLTKTVTNAATLTLPTGVTQIVTGILTLQGASGQLLSLRSSSDGTQWKIDPQSTRAISYLDVKDSWNVNSTVMDAIGCNCTNSGNNTNWVFVQTEPSNIVVEITDFLLTTTNISVVFTVTGTNTLVPVLSYSTNLLRTNWVIVTDSVYLPLSGNVYTQWCTIMTNSPTYFFRISTTNL